MRLIDAGQLEKLAQDDQLRAEMAGSRAFHGFEEAGDIASFAPTYKLLVPKLGGGGGGGGIGRCSTRVGPVWHDAQGKRAYSAEKNRVPAWCDRVLSHELDGSSRKLVCTGFGRSDALVTSDHAPVYASYDLRIPPPIKQEEPLYQARQ